MNKVKFVWFTAGVVLATIFTISCSSDNNDDGGDPSSSSLAVAKVSSSSDDNAAGPSSSSNGETPSSSSDGNTPSSSSAESVSSSSLSAPSSSSVVSGSSSSSSRSSSSVASVSSSSVRSSSSGGSITSCTPPSNRTFNDVNYGPRSRNQIDIKLPSSGNGPWPVILYIHGGAFMYGDKSVDAPFDKGPNRGYATAALRYTLAGSGRKAFPEAVEDALAAIRFLRAKAGDYCFNPDKVVVAGFSAGGYYTAIVAALTGASNHSFDNASLGNAGFSSKVQAAVSSAALTDLLLLDQQQKDLGGSNWMMSTHCGRSEMSGQLFGFDPCTATGANADIVASSNPLNYITAANCAGIPPILMQHGTGDNLIPYLQSKIMVDKLNEVCGAGKAQFKQHTGGHQAYGSETDIFKFLDNALK